MLTILLLLFFLFFVFRDKDKKANLVEHSAFVTARITVSFSWQQTEKQKAERSLTGRVHFILSEQFLHEFFLSRGEIFREDKEQRETNACSLFICEFPISWRDSCRRGLRKERNVSRVSISRATPLQIKLYRAR